uniref:Ribonuclease P/MRP protein subunit POP5 n=1 Tax=Tetraselmis chuii TaxID=63592 RepID=A0A7S1X7C3_9CHLO|mmetsp:Transcript_36125/g.64606  ORF Transcript_36125/g.64606 Transcript_36125/m.64606 type:complete len:142 (+) Transcript_36125:411-836(+)
MVRFKNRYLLMEMIWKDGKIDKTIDNQQMLFILRDAMLENFGTHGAGSVLSSLQVKYYNPVTSLLIIRCSRDSMREVWCCATLLSSVRHRTVLIRMVHHGGTLTSCQEVAVKYSQQVLKRLSAALQGQAGNAESDIMSLDL